MSFFEDVKSKVDIANNNITNLSSIQTTIVNTLFDQKGFINDLTTKYILKPLGAKGIGGFVFDIEREHRVELKSEITDHYIEDNSTIQDHIANAPELITLTGYVGELYNAPNGIVNSVQSIAQTAFAEFVVQKLTQVVALLPPMNATVLSKAQQYSNQLKAAQLINTNTANRTENIVEIALRSTVADTRQQRAYMILESMRRSKQIFTVQTPYEYFPTCAIQSIIVIQPEDTKYESEFTVVLKKMNFASISFIDLENAVLQGRTSNQSSLEVDKGKTKGVDVNPNSGMFQIETVIHGVSGI